MTTPSARRALVALAPLLAACAADATPTWAFDPVYLEPFGTGVFGLQTWNVYGEPWSEDRDERHFVCAVVTQLVGAPTSSCEACDDAWGVQATFVESDCDDALAEDPLFTSVVGVGLAPGPGSAEAPHPDQTVVGYIDYGFGWEVHGDAWPTALDDGGEATAATWDGQRAFTLWPTAIWPLTGAEAATAAPTATPVSRLTGSAPGARR